MKPDQIKKQPFDFTAEDSTALLQEWKDGFGAIPLPEKHFWIDGLFLDEVDLAEIAMTATYQFIDVNPDTWFWISVILLKDGTARLEFLCSYNTPEKGVLLPIVNRSLKRMGFQELEELNFPTRDLATWQEAYDFFCDLARSRHTAVVKPNLT